MKKGFLRSYLRIPIAINDEQSGISGTLVPGVRYTVNQTTCLYFALAVRSSEATWRVPLSINT